MSFDANSLPIGGGVLIAGAIIVGAALVLGPNVVGARTIERFDWVPRCTKAIIALAERDAPKPAQQKSVPFIDCNSLTEIMPGGDSNPFCKMFEFLFENPVGNQVTAQHRHAVQAHQEYIEQAALQATSRCACASTLVLSDRVPWALYAASGRLISGPKISNLDAELLSALSSPTCSGEFL